MPPVLPPSTGTDQTTSPEAGDEVARPPLGVRGGRFKEFSTTSLAMWCKVVGLVLVSLILTAHACEDDQGNPVAHEHEEPVTPTTTQPPTTTRPPVTLPSTTTTITPQEEGSCAANYQGQFDRSGKWVCVLTQTTEEACTATDLKYDDDARLCFGSTDDCEVDQGCDPNADGIDQNRGRACKDPRETITEDGCRIKAPDPDDERSQHCPAGEVFYSQLGCQPPCPDSGTTLVNGVCVSYQTGTNPPGTNPTTGTNPPGTNPTTGTNPPGTNPPVLRVQNLNVSCAAHINGVFSVAASWVAPNGGADSYHAQISDDPGGFLAAGDPAVITDMSGTTLLTLHGTTSIADTYWVHVQANRVNGRAGPVTRAAAACTAMLPSYVAPPAAPECPNNWHDHGFDCHPDHTVPIVCGTSAHQYTTHNIFTPGGHRALTHPACASVPDVCSARFHDHAGSCVRTHEDPPLPCRANRRLVWQNTIHGTSEVLACPDPAVDTELLVDTAGNESSTTGTQPTASTLS